MMQDLAIKAVQEKYFNSIRYFAHTLPNDKRADFIRQVSHHNLYLAARCAMTGEANKDLEFELRQVAELCAQNFSDPAKSAQGFLALTEFESYDIIFSLLSTVEKIEKAHSQILSIILSTATPQIFNQFLRLLSDLDQPLLIQTAISAYNGKVQIDSDNRAVFQKLIDIFIKNKHFGTLRILLSKFDLVDAYQYIMDQPIENAVHSFLKYKTYTAGNLAMELIEANHLWGRFSPEFLIKYFLDSSGTRGVLAALRLGEKHSLLPHPSINDFIIKTFNTLNSNSLITTKSKQLRKFKRILKKGIADYLRKYDFELYNKVAFFLFQVNGSRHPALRDHVQTVNTITRTTPEGEAFDELLKKVQSDPNFEVGSSTKNFLSKILQVYFQDDSQSLKFDSLLAWTFRKLSIGRSDVESLLRRFLFTGVVVGRNKSGYFVSCAKLEMNGKIFISEVDINSICTKSPSEIENGFTFFFIVKTLKWRDFSINATIPKNPAKYSAVL